MIRNGPLEGVLVKRIIDGLRKRGCWVVKIHGSAFQQAGIPDLVGCYRGRMFAFEVKRPREQLTDLQRFTLDEIMKAGGLALRVESLQEALDALGIADVPVRDI